MPDCAERIWPPYLHFKLNLDKPDRPFEQPIASKRIRICDKCVMRPPEEIIAQLRSLPLSPEVLGVIRKELEERNAYELVNSIHHAAAEKLRKRRRHKV